MELLILVFFLVLLLYTSELFLIVDHSLSSLHKCMSNSPKTIGVNRNSPVTVEVPRGPLCLNSRSVGVDLETSYSERF